MSEDLINKSDSPQAASESGHEVYARVALSLACRYLACGGPTSRLEYQLVRGAEAFGFQADVLAMPTGVQITVEAPGGPSTTRLARIKEFSIDLNELKVLDRLLSKLGAGKLPLSVLSKKLGLSEKRRAVFPAWQVHIGVFLIGLAAGLLRYGDPLLSVGSGLVSVAVLGFVASLPLATQSYRLFSDFLSCMLALGISLVGSMLFGFPFGALALGVFVAIVPGLSLTTAISELAEQNFLSGSIKLFKAGFTFLAMGLSLLLVADLALLFGVNPGVLTSSIHEIRPDVTPIFGFMGVALLVVGACVMFNSPKSFIPLSVLAGLSGYGVLWYFSDQPVFAIPAFMASFFVGLVSFFFGEKLKAPSQVISVPGILVMVPGMLALSSFKAGGLTDGGFDIALEMISYAALLAVAIVVGLVSAKLSLKAVGLYREVH